MNKHYSFEAHLLHSCLQMIWKKLNITVQMDAGQIFNYNKDQFYLVANGIFRRFGIACQETHLREAAQMLHYAFQLNIPKSHHIIVQAGAYSNVYNLTLDEHGRIVPADGRTEMSYSEAYDMLLNMIERYPGERFWLEQRIPRYVRGD